MDLANRLVELGNPGDVNEALMDLSAQVCAVKNPKCLICPLNTICMARRFDLIDELPKKKPKKATVHLEAEGLAIFFINPKLKSLEIITCTKAREKLACRHVGYPLVP